MILQAILLVFITRSVVITSGIPLSEFYPFGQQHGDSRVPTNDDGSSPQVEISTSFPYFNQLFHSLYVNTNGAISFSVPLSTYTPSPFPLGGDRKIVAPYWCDIDTRNGGDVWYYETNEQQLLQNATQDVREIFPSQKNFEAAWLFVATWDNVAFYGASTTGKTKRNTFQCLLITNGRNSFAIFLYNKIEWTTGTASQGNADTGLGGTPAQVGFDAGDGHNFLAINESRTDRVIEVTSLSNVEVPGKFVYRLDTETVTSGGCQQVTGGTLTIFPRYITMFGGTELSVGGPCVEEGDKIEIEFERVSGRQPCKRVSKTIIKCISPLANITGDVKVNLYVQRLNQDAPISLTAPGNLEQQSDKNTVIYNGISTYVNPLDMKKSLLYQLRPDEWLLDQDVTLGWDVLPFDTDTVEIEQFSVGTRSDNKVTLLSDGYVGRNISKFSRQHTFRLSTPRQAVIFKIHPEAKSTDYVANFPLVPSVWSDVFIPPSAYSNDEEQRIKIYCSTWKMLDFLKQPVNRNNVEICPCNINQARLDITRFSADPLCNTANNGNMRNKCKFSPDAVQCFRMVFLGQNGNDNQCCYDNNGNLIETNIHQFAGFAHRFHYKGGSVGNVPHLSNVHDDIVPFVYCCQFYRQYSPQQNNACTDFLNRRPASHCKGYVPPRIASTSGDPHMVTLDGLHYTFNGVGEFILVSDLDDELNIQGRMEQFKDDAGVVKPASVVTSVAIQCNSSEAVVEIRLNEIRLVDVLVNGELVDFADTNSVEKNGTTIVSSRSSNTTSSIWTSVTCRYPNIALNVTAVKKLINFNLMIVGQDMRGKLRGLLGNYNGRTDDDLTSRNGDVIPSDSSLEYIHQHFGLSWMTSANESLFTYPVGKNHDSFQKRDFQPVFNPTGQCTMNVSLVCGNDPACQFDLCTTNDASIAAITRQASEEMQNLAELTVPACGVLPNVANGNWNYSGHSASLECDNGYSPNGETTVECRQNGTWESTNTICEQTGCGLLEEVPNGRWNYNNNEAMLECIPGYSLRGSPTVQCVNGQWNQVYSRCEEEIPVSGGNTVRYTLIVPVVLLLVHTFNEMT